MTKCCYLTILLLNLVPTACDSQSDVGQTNPALTGSNAGTGGGGSGGTAGAGASAGSGGSGAQGVNCNNGAGCDNSIVVTPPSEIPLAATADVHIFGTVIQVDCPGYQAVEEKGIFVDCQRDSLTIGSSAWDENSALGQSVKEQSVPVRLVITANGQTFVDTGTLNTAVTSTIWYGGGVNCGPLCYIREVSLD